MEKTTIIGLCFFCIVTCSTWSLTKAAPTLEDDFLAPNSTASNTTEVPSANSTANASTEEPATAFTTAQTNVTSDTTTMGGVTVTSIVDANATTGSPNNFTSLPYNDTTDNGDNSTMPISIAPSDDNSTATSFTLPPAAQTTGPTKPTTKSPTTTTEKSKHKFDGGSFAGGIVLGMGIIFIAALAVYCIKFRNKGSYARFT